MSARSAILTLSTVGVCLTSCSAARTGLLENEDDSGLDHAPAIQTDQPAYTATRGTTYYQDGRVWGRYVKLTIGLRYTNSTRGPIYLPTCVGINPPVLEKKEGNSWVFAYMPVVPACLGPPEVIRPGKSFEYTYEVEAYLEGDRIWPQFEAEVPGTYRLVWGAYGTWTPDGRVPGLGRELPLPDRVSNEFEIVDSTNP